MAPLTQEEKLRHAKALAQKVIDQSGPPPATPSIKSGPFAKKPAVSTSPADAAPSSAAPPPPESYVLDESKFTDKLKLLVTNWRVSAYQGLNDFAEAELENGEHKTSGPDDASLGVALAVGIMNAIATVFPIEAVAATAAEKAAIAAANAMKASLQKATAEGAKYAGQRAVKTHHDSPTDSDRPISAVKEMMDISVEQGEQAFYDSISAKLKDVVHTLKILEPTLSDKRFPITDEDVFNRAAIALFGFDYVHGDGFNCEVNSSDIRHLFSSIAEEKYHEYMKEVHPIGEGRWGHKTVVMVAVTDRPKWEERTYAEVTRKSDDGVHDQYEFIRWIDDDMVEAAKDRMEDTVDEVAMTVVSYDAIDGLHRGSDD